MSEIDDIIAQHEQERRQDLKDDLLEISKIKLLIRNGKAARAEYDRLFFLSESVYEYTKDEKGGPRITKAEVDEVANELFSIATNYIESGESDFLGSAYISLADVYKWRKDNKKALECYDKAVEIDEKTFLSARGCFKNFTLNDRKGALQDYNRALEITTDPESRKFIEFELKSIDLLRDTDKRIFNFNVKFYLCLIAVIAALILQIISFIFGL